MLVFLLVVSVIICFIGCDAFTPQHVKVLSTNTHIKVDSTRTKNNEAPSIKIEKIRASVFQTPSPSNKNNNPLSILTQVADSLRTASLHGIDIVLFPELFLSCGENKVLDREGYELNIVGNICQELNVACIIGYAESIHESELKNNKTNAYNSIAAFNADGSRAGNYRSISDSNDDDDFLFRTGQPFVESIPTLIQLPNKGGDTISTTKEVKVGLMCGNDVLIPEHTLNLVRLGSQAIFACTSFKNDDLLVMECFIPTRAAENQVPFAFANYAQPTEETGVNELNNFVGSSAIVSKDGGYLVCAPKKEGDDLPIDCGYLIPCQIGALYAADIEISIDIRKSSLISKSMEQWELIPRIPDTFDKQSKNEVEKKHVDGNGFGRGIRRTSKAKK